MESIISPDVKHPVDNQKKINKYIEQLTPQEKMVLNIAREHLETSFDIEKSIGYLKWRESHYKDQ